jgi:hypothetical protein
MSSEVCCLTTPVGFAREIVHDEENGVLLPFNDAQAFTERTASLIAGPEKRSRLARAARKPILEKMHVRLTMQRVPKVYAKALSVAQERLSTSPVNFSLESMVSQDLSATERNEVPLSGFPRELHARVRMLEALVWSEQLILYHQQRTVALKLILRQWIENPFSLLPLRVILRRFIPRRIVKAVVRLKNGSPPKLKELPG